MGKNITHINCHDFESLDAVIDHVKLVDQNEERFRAYLAEPFFLDNDASGYAQEARILKQFDTIFANPGLSTKAKPGDRLKWAIYKRMPYYLIVLPRPMLKRYVWDEVEHFFWAIAEKVKETFQTE